MQRQEAIKKASKFLGRKEDIKTGATAKQIKKRAKKNPDLNRAALTQIIADVFQRGLSPKDIDLQKIDFGVSYSNIRSQVQKLAKKRGGKEFKQEKKNRMESMADKAKAQMKEAKHNMLMQKAEAVQRGRDKWALYTDQTKDADETIDKLDEDSYRRWRRNRQTKDIKGLDNRMPPERRVNVAFPFRKSTRQRVKEMMMKNEEEESDEISSPDRYKDFMSKKEIISEESSSGNGKIWGRQRSGKSYVSRKKEEFF